MRGVLPNGPAAATTPTAGPMRLVWAGVLWTGLYVALGLTGGWFAVGADRPALFAPEAGLAVAGLLLFGWRFLAVVGLGALLLHLGLSWPIEATNTTGVAAMALGGGLVAAIQAGAAALLMRHVLRSPLTLLDARSIVIFVLLAGVLAGAIGALGRLVLSGFPADTGWEALFLSTWFANITGVAVCSPLVMAWSGSAGPIWHARRTSIALPMVIVLGAVALLAQHTRQIEHAGTALEFRHRVDLMASSLQRDLEHYLTITQDLGQLFVASTEVTRAEFRDFVTPTLSRHPGIRAMSWNPRVTRQGRSRYHARAAGDGLPDFRITERDAEGSLQTAGERDDYVMVFYIEPHAGNEDALGFDVASNPVRRAALHRARDTAQPVATGALRLVQERAEQAGILLFVPVYHGESPIDTVEQRRQRLHGYAVGVFRIGDMLAAALTDLAVDLPIEVHLHDDTAGSPGELLAAVSDGTLLDIPASTLREAADPGRHAVEHRFAFAGRDWRLEFLPSPGYLATQRTLAPWLVLAGGLLFATLLSTFQLLLTGRQAALAASNKRLRREAKQRQSAQLRQRESEARYRALVEHAPEAIVVLDTDLGRFVDVNDNASELFGLDRRELLRRHPGDLSPPTQPDGSPSATRAMDYIGQALAGSSPRFEWTHRNAQGHDIPCEIWLVQLPAEGRRLVRGSIIDITERKQAEQTLYREKEKAMVTLHSIGEAVIVTDHTGAVEYLNPVAETMTGWSMADARGRPINSVLTLLDYSTHRPLPELQPCLIDGCVHLCPEQRGLLRSRSGNEFAIQGSIAPIRGQSGEVLGSVLAFSDITELRQLTEQLAHRAMHDALTGLVNRDEFERRLADAITAQRQRHTPHALAYLDLDQFKIVNDTVGHRAGDQLLKQVTQLLLENIRTRDTLGRIGGDEFCILFVDCTLEDATRIAETLVEAVGEYRFTWQGRSFEIGVSIGVLSIDDQGDDVGPLMGRADMACYAAKERGRNQVFTCVQGDREIDRRQVEMLRATGLREALREGRFQLYMQPIEALQANQDGRRFNELLLRMLDTDGTLVRPGRLIPAAERFGMMGAIDRWVIETAFAQCRHGVAGQADAGITINLSGNSLNERTLLDFVLQQQAVSGIAPERVCFEITETAAINHLHHALDFIHGLRAHGFRFALDDFGSGLSSFNYLKRFAVDFVKIDGSFVQRLVDEPTDRALVASINQLCHSLGIKTVAERAETQATVDALRELGVDYVQGYAIARESPLITPAAIASSA